MSAMCSIPSRLSILGDVIIVEIDCIVIRTSGRIIDQSDHSIFCDQDRCIIYTLWIIGKKNIVGIIDSPIIGTNTVRRTT